jgi:hypothetical protein
MYVPILPAMSFIRARPLGAADRGIQMKRAVLGLLVVTAVAAGGCTPQTVQKLIGEKPETTLVPPNVENMKPGAQSAAPAPVSYPKGQMATCLRVDLLGRKILAANPQAGLQPEFFTIASPQVELFHKGPNVLYITEGLAKKCTTEAQLAAILCRELGRMVAEREVLASIATRSPDRGPPPEVPWGNAGQIGAADQVRYAEVARLAPQKRRFDKPLPPPDPTRLAHLYLRNAGYREDDLEDAAPLLQEANHTYQAEKLIKTAPASAPWTPAR